MPPAAHLPPGVDSAAWAALNETVKKQPAPRAKWRTHARLAGALAEAEAAGDDNALVLAHDCLVLPWFCGATGAWRNLPRAGCTPDCVKRFLCAPSLAAFQEYEATLRPKQRHFYECLREKTAVRYWLDLDLAALDALRLQLRVDGAAECRDALACMLQRHVIDAMAQLFMVERRELLLLLVDGNGDAAEQGRVSLHAIVHGALLPDNEFAAAAVRLAVIDRLKACGRDGSDPTAAALLRCTQLETVVDRVNSRNRLRRLTGHTKIGQDRHSKALTSCVPLPPGAYFVSGAAACGRERVLMWRASAVPRAPPSATPLAPRAHNANNEQHVGPPSQAAAAIEAECLAIELLHGAPVFRLLPPTDKYPCWTAFTACSSCPWRAQESPESGRAPGPRHRSARLYVSFYRDRLELGCTAPRHAQRATLGYMHAASQHALFPSPPCGSCTEDAVACLTAQMMEISPLRDELPRGQQQENMLTSPYILAHLDDIFTPRFAAPPAEPLLSDRYGVTDRDG